MGARLLVEETLEDVLLMLLLFELIDEDVGSFDDVFAADDVEDFAEETELDFLLAEEEAEADDFEDGFANMLDEEGLTDDFDDDFAEELVLNFLLVEAGLTEDFAEPLAAN